MTKTQVASRLLFLTGLGTVLRRAVRTRGVVVLTYHRVGDGSNSNFDQAVWSATVESFDCQVRFLKRNFDIIGPADLSEVRRRGSGRYVMITFDDGYRDNFLQAFPVLRSHGATATFFLSTGFLDQPHPAWWDEIAWMVRRSPRDNIPQRGRLAAPIAFDNPGRERAIGALLSLYKSLPGESTSIFMDFLADATGSGRCPAKTTSDTWMTWDMVRQMRASGMTIGGHTVNHPILSRLARPQQQSEIEGCRRRIEQELNEPMRWLSYPRGKPDSFNEDTRACLREAGVELGFSYYGGFQSFADWDPYDVRRSPVEMETSFEEFKALVTLPQVFAATIS